MTIPQHAIISQAGTAVAFDFSHGTPQILYWGADLGRVDLAQLREAIVEPTAHAELDEHLFHGVWRENARGNIQRPALLGHRNGTVFQVIAGKRNHTPIEFDPNSCGAVAVSNTTLLAFNDSGFSSNSISYVALGYCNV